MIEAVAFDMDGVIFDTEKLYRMNWMRSAKEFGIPEEEMAGLLDKIAGARKDTNSRLMKSIYGEDFDYEAFRNNTMKHMDDYIAEHGVELKKGVVELLDFLKTNDIKTVLATSTHEDRATGFLKSTGIYDKFDKLVFGDNVKNGKPAPDIYLEAIKAVDSEASRTIGIEDSINGLKSSHSAGLYTIMVVDLIKPTKEVKDEIADKIMDDLYQVMEFIKENNGIE